MYPIGHVEAFRDACQVGPISVADICTSMLLYIVIDRHKICPAQASKCEECTLHFSLPLMCVTRA